MAGLPEVSLAESPENGAGNPRSHRPDSLGALSAWWLPACIFLLSIAAALAGQLLASLAFAAGGAGMAWVLRRAQTLEAARLRTLQQLEIRFAQTSSSAARFQHLTERATDVLYRLALKPSPRIEYASPSVTGLTGYTPAELASHPALLMELFTESDLTALTTAVPGEGVMPFVVAKLSRKGGGSAWIEARQTTETNAQGEAVAVYGVMRDVTEDRQAAEVRREGDQRLTRIVETVADGLLILNRKGSVTFANAAAERIFGLPRGAGSEVWLEEERRTGFGAALVSLLEAFKFEDGCRNFHYTVPQQDGEAIILSVNADALPSVPGGGMQVVASVRDVTLERRTEQGLVESEARLTILNGILSVMAAGCGFDEVVARTLQHLATYFPKRLISYHTLGADGLLTLVSASRPASGLVSWQLSPESDLSRLLHGGALVNIKDCELDPLCEPCRREFASACVRAMILSPFLDGDERAGVLGMHHHDTCDWSDYEVKTMREAVEHLSIAYRQARTEEQRKAAKGALAAEKERLAVTLRSITDAVVTVDSRAHVLLLNEAAEKLTGWSQKEAAGRPVAEVFSLYQEREKLQAGLVVTGVLIHGRSVDSSDTYRLAPRLGSERLVTQSAGPIHDTSGGIAGAVAVFRDVTAKRRAEEEMLKASKLESVGLLAGGIAHDFNNILTVVLGAVSLAKLSSSPGGEQESQLVKAAQGCLRARDLTQQLLTFSRGGAPIKRAASLEEILRESVGFALRGANVSGQFRVEEGLWPVEVDVAQINQVVHNLVLNAVQAMPFGGRITINLANRHQAEGEIAGFPDGKYVELVLEDTGEGISPENLKHIFDPYFTTKVSGTGLGLATTYSIIQKHRGHISVQSTPGAGTSFRVLLPAAEKLPVAPVVPASLKVGNGRILVMDDEPMIRDLSRAMLLALGYKVSLAAEGREAVSRYREAMEVGDPFDAVIMDLTVPEGMGGQEAMRLLLEIDPEVRGLVSSGYSQNPIMANFSEHGFQGVVAKPYQIQTLGAALHEVLSAEADGFGAQQDPSAAVLDLNAT